jgi:GTP cyclohydrolase IA
MNTALAQHTLSVHSSITPEAEKVRDALISKGLETPMLENNYSQEEKLQRIQKSFGDIMVTLGLDLTDDSLQDTPERIAKMYVQEIFSGLDYSQFPKISMIENKMNASDVVRISDISMISTCEHHFVTIDGLAKVAYIPGEKIIGLSKINRIVQFFAQRPQVQERLCYQIVLALQTLLGVEDVAVSIDATHYCVKARGVMDSSSTTRTNVLRGKFDSDSLLRAEFLG